MVVGDLKMEIGFLVDGLTAMMMCVVTFVSLMGCFQPVVVWGIERPLHHGNAILNVPILEEVADFVYYRKG
jgi:hypothetical protein